MAKVTFSADGRAEFRELHNYLLRKTDFEFTRKTMRQIRAELQRLADTVMLDRENSQFENPRMRWYWLLDSRFQVYYERQTNGIKVTKLWAARREPLDPGEI